MTTIVLRDSGASGAPSPARRADLDWLRVIAFGLLIYFHAAVVFLPQGIPMVINPQASPTLQVFVAFLQEFRLGLLFMVSGMGVRFALRRRSRNEFFAERGRRLLIPLVFGMLVLVPPMVYLEKLFIGDAPGTFIDFYSNLFSGVYPNGNLSWHHFWFVAYLFIYCICSWRVFSWISGSRFAQWAGWLANGYHLFCFAAVLLCAELPLRAMFPGFRDLIHDWASFSHWWLLFLAGFSFITYPELLKSCRRLRRPALLLGLLCTALLFGHFFSFSAASFSPAHDGQVSVLEYVVFCVLRMLNAWCWLLACVGYAGRYLQKPGPLLTYLTQAVYPLFCLHLTISVTLSFLLVPLALPVAVKYVLITSGTIVLSLLIYHLLIRPSVLLRPLFGLTPRQLTDGGTPRDAQAS